MHDVTLISFGYSHGPAPEGAILLADVRSVLYDPSVAASGLLDLDGRDPAIADIVERSPLARDLVGVAADMARDSTRLWCTIAIGCAGGRHRSVALVEAIAADLACDPEIHVTVVHRDVERPRLPLSARNEVGT